MTIVEVMTWKSSSFSLDLEKTELCDEYRCFPEILHPEMLLNAQGLVMGALRIYDEKLLDGRVEQIFFSTPAEAGNETPAGGAANPAVIADLLGLGALDTLTNKIPDVFIGLKDHDYSEERNLGIAEELGRLPPNRRELLRSFLEQISEQSPAC